MSLVENETYIFFGFLLFGVLCVSKALLHILNRISVTYIFVETSNWAVIWDLFCLVRQA